MRAPVLVLITLVASLVLALPVAAQEGHPLKGSWLGTWGPSQDHADTVVVIMDWDGQNITGVVNPGTDNMEIENATLNPDGWVLRFEATGESRSGSPLHYVIEGAIQNLPFNNRSITGTWRDENESGTFEITRQ